MINHSITELVATRRFISAHGWFISANGGFISAHGWFISAHRGFISARGSVIFFYNTPVVQDTRVNQDILNPSLLGFIFHHTLCTMQYPIHLTLVNCNNYITRKLIAQSQNNANLCTMILYASLRVLYMYVNIRVFENLQVLYGI